MFWNILVIPKFVSGIFWKRICVPAGGSLFLCLISPIYLFAGHFCGGVFEYTERGILDRTHFRFFTRSSIYKLFQSVGLNVDQLAPTPIPLPLVNPIFEEGHLLWFLHRVNSLTARLFPALFGYQIILYGQYIPKS